MLIFIKHYHSCEIFYILSTLLMRGESVMVLLCCDKKMSNQLCQRLVTLSDFIEIILSILIILDDTSLIFEYILVEWVVYLGGLLTWGLVSRQTNCCQRSGNSHRDTHSLSQPIAGTNECLYRD